MSNTFYSDDNLSFVLHLATCDLHHESQLDIKCFSTSSFSLLIVKLI